MFVMQIVSSVNFEIGMLFIILLSSLCLCFDDQTVVNGSPKARVLQAFDIFFTITFGLEVTVFCVSLTFIHSSIF